MFDFDYGSCYSNRNSSAREWKEMKKRNLSLDIYRILCMFLITTIHIVNYSNLMDHIHGTHLNFWLINCVKVLQIFSISGFTLISAYYLVDKPSNSKKIISFVLQVAFYSIQIFLLSLVFITRDFSKILLLKSVFPLLTYHYWYPVSYIILLVLAPFLNKMVHAFTGRELLTAIGVLAAVVSGFYHLDPFFDPYLFVGHHTHGLIWFILLYFIAAYIKIHGVKRPRISGVGMFLVSGFLLLILFVLSNNGFGLAQKYPVIEKAFEKVNLLSYNSILSLLFTVSSFIMFTHIRITPAKWLSKASAFVMPAVFVIYLVQEHDAVRYNLWNFVDITRWANSYLLLPVIFAVFIALFVIAIGLYLIYRLFHRLVIYKLENILFAALQKIKKTVVSDGSLS